MGQGWGGITGEADRICLMAGLPNVSSERLDRKSVKEAMEFHLMKKLKEEIEKKEYMKLDTD